MFGSPIILLLNCLQVHTRGVAAKIWVNYRNLYIPAFVTTGRARWINIVHELYTPSCFYTPAGWGI